MFYEFHPAQITYWTLGCVVYKIQASIVSDCMHEEFNHLDRPASFSILLVLNVSNIWKANGQYVVVVSTCDCQFWEMMNLSPLFASLFETILFTSQMHIFHI